ncbi:MAG: hypothetical protein PVS3B3_24830 [Ktedonobacteraceae bacterium]
MTLLEALKQSRFVQKRVADGTYTVSKANLSAGYYKDFKPSDPARCTPVSTSAYYNPFEVLKIAEFVGEDGWEIC